MHINNMSWPGNARPGAYDYVANSRFIDMANKWSLAARNNINTCDKPMLTDVEKRNALGPTRELLVNAQEAVAAVLYRFMCETGQL